MKTNYFTPSRKYTRLIVLLIAALGMAFLTVKPAYAQSPVYAEVDRTTLSTGEMLTLTIVVNDANAGAPGMPMLDGFQIVNTSKSSQLSITNGNISSLATYNYILQPTRTGALTIPSIPVTVGGQTYTTQPITIEVTQGAAPAQPAQPAAAPDAPPPAPQGFTGQDMYVESVVDNPTPYVGQQVTHTFRFYRAVNYFGQPSYEAPNFSGFWSENESQQTDYDAQVGGRIYRVVELKTVLFPTSAGEHTIDPAKLTIPGSLLSVGTRLQTQPVTLNVRPLPQPAPEGYHGAVGQYSISTEVDTDQVAVNEAVTLQVVVSGAGNINTLPDPELPILDGWRAFESTSTVNTHTQDGVSSGSRVTEQLLVPGSAGEYIIPAISYTYFDPQAETYQTVSTNPIAVNVAEGAAIAPDSQAPGAAGLAVEKQDSDIRYIKPVPENLEMAAEPFYASPAYWALWMIPVGAVVADSTYRRRRRFLDLNPDRVRSSQAAKNAQRQLDQARRQKSDPYAAINQALTGYLGDHFNQPVSGMTQTNLTDFLAQNGVPPSTNKRISETLLLCELGRFGLAEADKATAAELFKQARDLIANLEKALS